MYALTDIHQAVKCMWVFSTLSGKPQIFCGKGSNGKDQRKDSLTDNSGRWKWDNQYVCKVEYQASILYRCPR